MFYNTTVPVRNARGPSDYPSTVGDVSTHAYNGELRATQGRHGHGLGLRRRAANGQECRETKDLVWGSGITHRPAVHRGAEPTDTVTRNKTNVFAMNESRMELAVRPFLTSTSQLNVIMSGA